MEWCNIEISKKMKVREKLALFHNPTFLCGIKNLKVPKKNSARKECACFLNGDIGAYNSCAHLCRYCYANADSRLVLENMKLHNPDSPLLIGELTPDDKIFNTAQKSWIVE